MLDTPTVQIIRNPSIDGLKQPLPRWFECMGVIQIAAQLDNRPWLQIVNASHLGGVLERALRGAVFRIVLDEGHDVLVSGS